MIWRGLLLGADKATSNYSIAVRAMEGRDHTVIADVPSKAGIQRASDSRLPKKPTVGIGGCGCAANGSTVDGAVDRQLAIGSAEGATVKVRLQA